MKRKIKIKSIKEISLPKKNFVYVDFFSESKIDKKQREWENIGIKLSPDLLKKIKSDKSKKLKFNPAFNTGSKIVLIKFDENKIDADFFRDSIASFVTDVDESIDSIVVNYPCEGEFIQDKFRTQNYYEQTIIEGILLGNYTFDKYKSDKEKPSKLDVIIKFCDTKSSKKIITKATKIIDAVTFTRDLVNEPANVLTPQEFALRINREFKNTNVSVTIYNAKQIKKKNMNALFSVGKASSNPPLLITLTYKPNKAKKKFALVGKGVMYDSGGLSLKPTPSMVDMKADMAGAATVAGIIKAAESLKLPVSLTAVLPVVENVISGNAYKPGDIIHTASGKTIEIGNTDAEGRLILADALEFAEKTNPDFIFDFATLTGACLVALGESYAGFFTDNDEIARAMISSSELTSENIWRLPLPEKYQELLKSELADISNIGSSRWGGAITAALFLKFFLSDKMKTNWAHFDIAGPAMKHNQASYTKKYATGFGVRLFLDYFEALGN